MQMIRSIFKFVGFTILSLSLLAACATREQVPRPFDSQCVLACQASYANALAECIRFVAPIANQSAKDQSEAVSLVA